MKVSEMDAKYLPDMYDAEHERSVRESEQFYIDCILNGDPFIFLLSQPLEGDILEHGYSAEFLCFARVELVRQEDKPTHNNALVLAFEQAMESAISDDFLLELGSQHVPRAAIIEYFSRFAGFRGIATRDTWQNPKK